MKKSKITFIYDKGHFILILSVLIILISVSYYFILAVIFYFFFIAKHLNCLKIIIFSVISILSLSLLLIPVKNDLNGVFIVIKTSQSNYQNYEIIVKKNTRNYTFYSNDCFEIGDLLKINGELHKFNKNTKKNTYNNFQIKKSQNNHGIIKVLSINKIGFVPNLPKYLNLYILKLNPELNNYVQAFVINNKSYIKNIVLPELVSNINYLLSVSLIHINIMKKILSRILFKIGVSEQLNNTLIIVFELIIALLNIFSLLFIRIIVNNILKILLIKDCIVLTALDKISVKWLIILIFNSYLILNMAFLLLVIISFGNYFHKIKNRLFKACFIYLLGLPFFITFSGGISLVSIFGVFFLVPIIIAIFCLIIFSLFLPFIINICVNIVSTLLNTALYIINFDVIMRIAAIPITIFILYYCFLIIVKIINKHQIKLTALFFIAFMVFFSLSHQKPNEIIFLSVGQGDTTIINFEKTCIVIDAFEGTNDFLIRNNYRKIDGLFLTHNDYDHVADVKQIINNFKIDKIYGNPYDKYQIYAIESLRTNDLLFFGSLQMHILHPDYDYQKSNNNSLVMWIEFKQVKICLTGDIESEAVKNLSKNNLIKPCDILKIPHHGSKNIYLDELLKLSMPSISIVSVGLNNLYRLPNKDTIDSLNKITTDTYLTSIHGSIHINLDTLKVTFFAP